MLDLATARLRLLATLSPLPSQIVALPNASRRVLAQDLTAPLPLPPFDNSSMDGFALRASDTRQATPSSPVTLTCTTLAAAGNPSTVPLSQGHACRIFTGAPIPNGADAVVMQEDATLSQDRTSITLTEPVRPWENIRFAGEDIRKDAVAATAGTRLHSAHLGLLAALGIDTVPVRQQPRFHIVTSGNELRPPGHALQPGEIYESNSTALQALLLEAGGLTAGVSVASDRIEDITQVFAQAAANADCVVSIGGASVGDFDLARPAIQQLGGSLDFWKLAIRPGKPFFLASIGNTPVFGLPGNPVSAFITALLLVVPAFLHLQGSRDPYPNRQPGRLAMPIENPGQRTLFARVRRDAQGRLISAGPQGSHILSSLAAACGIVEVPPGTSLPAGTEVELITWSPGTV